MVPCNEWSSRKEMQKAELKPEFVPHCVKHPSHFNLYGACQEPGPRARGAPQRVKEMVPRAMAMVQRSRSRNESWFLLEEMQEGASVAGDGAEQESCGR